MLVGILTPLHLLNITADVVERLRILALTLDLRTILIHLLPILIIVDIIKKVRLPLSTHFPTALLELETQFPLKGSLVKIQMVERLTQ